MDHSAWRCHRLGGRIGRYPVHSMLIPEEEFRLRLSRSAPKGGLDLGQLRQSGNIRRDWSVYFFDSSTAFPSDRVGSSRFLKSARGLRWGIGQAFPGQICQIGVGGAWLLRGGQCTLLGHGNCLSFPSHGGIAAWPHGDWLDWVVKSGLFPDRHFCRTWQVYFLGHQIQCPSMFFRNNLHG
jgi:hypothetical protein